MAHRIVELTEDKQASDIMLLDIRKQSTVADYFVICSAENERQLRAIVEHVAETISRECQLDPRIEGTSTTGWVLLDYDDVVVHVFGAVQRAYYQLERLWDKAAPVIVVQ